MSRLVLDSSVVIAASMPAEAAHADALAFLERLRVACAARAATVFAPPELWLEVHVVERRLVGRDGGRPKAHMASPLTWLPVELIAPADREAITRFLDRLTARTRGRRPFANATDLVYLWAAFEVDAVLVTLDQGLLGYDHAVCEVRRPQDAWFR
jgi:hypothetical protein